MKVREKKVENLQEVRDKRIHNKKLLGLFAILFVLVFLFLFDRYLSNKKIFVVEVNKPVIAGDLLTTDIMSKGEISKDKYSKQGMVEVEKDGKKTKEQKYILWRDRKEFTDKYINNYHDAYSSITKHDVSDQMVFKNPLIEAMPKGNELYSLPIDASGININNLLPSTTLRVRVPFKVPASLEREARQRVSAKTVYDGSSEVLKLLEEKGYTVSNAGADSASTSEGQDDKIAIVSEVIFDEIVAVDMQSTAKESIYEVYMALMRMPIEKRIPYLKTSFDNDVSGTFRKRVTPSTLELNLDKESASHMHEYSEMGYNVKYTIVKKDNTSDMLKKFMDINQQIQEVIKVGETHE